jgi:hypothetical protein
VLLVHSWSFWRGDLETFLFHVLSKNKCPLVTVGWLLKMETRLSCMEASNFCTLARLAATGGAIGIEFGVFQSQTTDIAPHGQRQLRLAACGLTEPQGYVLPGPPTFNSWPILNILVQSYRNASPMVKMNRHAL